MTAATIRAGPMPGRSHSGHRSQIVWRIGLALTIGSTVAVALALGGAHTYVLLAAAPVCLLGYACLLTSFESVEGVSVSWPAPVWVFAGLAGYSALQAVPLPVSVLEFLSPEAADIWAHALSPFDEVVEWGALSLDPGASLREALKWLLYGLNFVAAVLVARRYGRAVPALVVCGCALVVAAATVGHE